MSTDMLIGVVGLGTIGVEELKLWRRAGYPTVGYDVAAARAAALQSATSDGRDPSRISARFAELDTCQVLVLCLPNVDASARLTTAAFDRFAHDIQSLETRDRLVVLASTVPIGFSRKFAARLGVHGSAVAHVPERFDPGRGVSLGEIPRVAGATTPAALDRAHALYAGAGVPIHAVDPIEVAEASKLLENAFRLVNIAFINEFAELCRGLGIAAADVVSAAATKPFAFMAHYPGAGAGGTCIPSMPEYLLDAARENQLALPILQAAVAGNQELPRRIEAYLRSLLASNGLNRGKVLVVGVTYKPNYPDARASAALRLALELRKRHDVLVLDPIVDAHLLPPDLNVRRELAPDDRFDAVLIAVKHRGIEEEALRGRAPILIDLVRGDVALTRAGASAR